MTNTSSTTPQPNLLIKYALLGAGAFVMIRFLMDIFGDTGAVRCNAQKPGLLNIVHLYNGCDFPINAVQCREFLYRNEYCHFKQFAPGELMDMLSNGSLLVDIALPIRVRVYGCKVGYIPRITRADPANYRCDKGSDTTPRAVTRI